MKYRAEIDGLRALAVVPVILFHAGFELFSGGYVGVDVFFVISGYLITTIILNEMRDGRFSLVAFYERRARRILPALFLVALVCVPFAWFLLPLRDMREFAQSLVGVATFSSNFFFWNISGYFDTAAEFKPLLHTWSLAVEEQYYILFPLLLLAAWRFGRGNLLVLLVCLFAASFAVAQWASLNSPASAFFLLPARGWEILLGAFCAFYLARGERERSALRDKVLSLVGLALILLAVFGFDARTPMPGVYALVPTVGAALVILHCDGGRGVGRLLSHRLLVGFGLISYSAYLWHQPVLAFARHYFFEGLTAAGLLLLCGLSFVLAYFSWRFVEIPFRKGPLLPKRRVLSVATTSLLVLAAIGIGGSVTDGFLNARRGMMLAATSIELEKAVIERQRAIKAGICHFNRRGRHRDIDEFLARWRCYADDEGLVATNILVFGDSHSADKVIALRSAGYDVVQLGGADCVVAPSRVSADKKHCERLFRKAEELLHSVPLSAVVLANRFPILELDRDYMADMLAYWGGWDVPVYLFSPMPDFDRQIREYPRRGTTTLEPDFSGEERFFRLLAELEVPANIAVIKTSELWCEDGVPSRAKPCSVSFDGDLLMIDRDHLSVYGAREFAAQMVRHSRLREVLPD